ncbi:MAG: diguanylate cyclase [Blautia sp.]|nr:diguanylate cyclase [Blautia sp.]MDY5031627.1 diguanylate cyclase [Blautia sp.]
MGTYGYISMIAMLCYGFMLLTFLAAKRNKLVNSFLIVLVGLIFWTGGSVFMRTELWPSYKFWFQVSLLGILLLPYAYYRFTLAFGGVREHKTGKAYLIIILLCFLINIPGGILLKSPELVEKNGVRSFVYDINLNVCVFFFAAAALLIHMFWILYRLCRKNLNMKRQYEPIIAGILVLFVGNMLIAVPFFTGFPIDLLCGLINAFFLLYALIKRRLFRLQLLASPGLCYAVGLFLSLLLFFNLSPYLQELIGQYAPSRYYPLFYAVLFLVIYTAFTFLWRLLVNNVFVKEELHQAEKLKEFSLSVSRTLDLKEIMSETIRIIKETMDVDSIYICMQEQPQGLYRALYSDKPLNDLSVSLEEQNPMIQWMLLNDEPLIYQEFKYTVEYKSMWESEKNELEKMGLRCCVALKDAHSLTGVILIASRNSRKTLLNVDVQMLSSVSSVASIAIKNAKLYERAYLEARTDEMTGLLNRKYFYEVLNEEFEKNRDGSLALAIINVDDFKLYNQLYGQKEGDRCLIRIADIIRRSVGDSGYTARYSGKEFAVLLPKYDIYSARNLVESVAGQIYEMNNRYSEMKLKSVTVSAGISASPYAAKNVKELVETVDLAVYHVKHSGKNGIQVFDAMFQNVGGIQKKTDHVHIYQEYESTIYALTAAIDAKDHYTFSHSNNVAYYATELASYIGLNADVIEIIRQAALLHDVGKIGIPEVILNKQERLTSDEYEVIKGHVEASIDIVRHLPSLDYVIPAVIGHHERYDGKGYPRRIAGEDIPLTARVLCIADSFDAMTSKRCYKKAYSFDLAIQNLLEGAGTQFDPELVRVFVKCLKEGKIKLVDSEFSGNHKAST